MTLTDRTIAALRTSYDSLASMAAGLTSADLECRSGADEWTVGDVLAHLGGAAEVGVSTLDKAVAGAGGLDGDVALAIRAQWNATDPADLVPAFLEVSGRFVDRFESFDSATRSDLRVTVPFLPFPAPLELYSGTRAFEALMHGWDVRSAFDEDATIPADEAAVLLEQFTGPMAFVVGILGKPASLSGRQAKLLTNTTAPSSRFRLVFAETVSIDDEIEDADGVLTGPAEAVLRLLAGRLKQPGDEQRLRLDSAALSMVDLRGVFAGY